MQRGKAIFIGSLTGFLTSAFTVVLLTVSGDLIAGWLGWQLSVAAVLAPICLLQGVLCGALCGVLGSLLNCWETRIICLMAALALGATAVILGGYSAASPAPLAIYAVALLNGALIAGLSCPLIRRFVIEENANVIIG